MPGTWSQLESETDIIRSERYPITNLSQLKEFYRPCSTRRLDFNSSSNQDQTTSSLSFSSDLARGVLTRETRAAAREERRVTAPIASAHCCPHFFRASPVSCLPPCAWTHFRVSSVSLDGQRKKRDCSQSNQLR